MEFEQSRWPVIPGNEFLLNDGGNKLFTPNDTKPAFGMDRPVKWGEAQHFSLTEMLPWVEFLRSNGKMAFPAHLGSGSILWFDFDDRPSRADANYGTGQTVETAQQAYDSLLSDCMETTYVERSRTSGRYHAAFQLPPDHGLPLRQIKGMHGIDLLIGNGWVRLTGESNGKAIANIPENLLKQLQATASNYSFETHPHSEIENDPALCALPLDEAVAETRRRMATGMGAWSPERRISREIWEWSKGYVINSVAYLLGQHEAGALDAGTPALAQKIMTAMEQFFDGSGSQHHSQQEMRAAGRFRLGSLPNFRRIDELAKKVNDADPIRPLAAAVEMLKLRGVVEVFKDDKDFTKRIYCKGRAYDEGSE